MRRSIFMAVAGASLIALSLAACSPAPQAQSQSQVQPQQQTPLYASVNECVQAGNQKDLCEQSFQQASTNTPRFNTVTSCEAQYGPGACQSHGDWVGPALMGFMVGNMLSSNSNGYYRGGHYDYDYDYYHRSYRQPTVVNHYIYRDQPSSSTYRTSASAPAAPTVTRNGFNTATPPSANTARPAAVVSRPAASMQVVTATRSGGGFGSSSSYGSRTSSPSFGSSSSSFGSSRSSSFGSSSFGSSRSSSFGGGGGFGGSRGGSSFG